jgi:hypothetical protein
MLRCACRESWSAGAGLGGGAIVVLCKPIQGREDAARGFVKDTLASSLMQSNSLVRMALWETDAAFSGGTSPEMALRGGADKSADWILFLESCDLTRTGLALQTQLSACTAGETGLLIDSCTRYQLIYAHAV